MPIRRSGRSAGPSSPTATSGLAASRSTQSSTSGHGSACRSTGSSRSVVAVSRTVARSVHTWARRGARTASAAPSSTASSASPASARQPLRPRARRRPVQHAGRVELGGAVPGRRGASSAERRSCRRAPVEQVAQLGDERRPTAARRTRRTAGRRPGAPPRRSCPAGTGRARRPGARRVVAGQPPAQVAVQGDDVEQRLQRVVGPLHRRGERRRPVVPRRQVLALGAEPVRLVVDDDEPRAPSARTRRTASRLPVR